MMTMYVNFKMSMIHAYSYNVVKINNALRDYVWTFALVYNVLWDLNVEMVNA